MSVNGQCLLARRPDTTREEFRKYYTEHHARLVMPFFLDWGVMYYAQLHGPLSWSSAAQAANPDIKLEEWDAVAEAAFGAKGAPVRGDGGSEVATRYYEDVILPDERCFLWDEAMKHMRIFGEGGCEGERVEFIVGGEAVVRGWEGAEELWRGTVREVEGGQTVVAGGESEVVGGESSGKCV